MPHASASFSYVDGDATVPAESATAHGLQAAASLEVKGAHRDLIAMQASVWRCAQRCAAGSSQKHVQGAVDS